jgi:hypothetical protein
MAHIAQKMAGAFVIKANIDSGFPALCICEQEAFASE